MKIDTKKWWLCLLLPVLLLLLSGCNNPTVGPAAMRLSVATAVGYSVQKYPQAIPGIKAGADIICAQASATNLSPANVVAAVNAYTEMTPESVLILNAGLGFYTLLWNSYGENAVKNSPLFQQYLLATCGGIRDGLGVNGFSAQLSRQNCPQIRWPVPPPPSPVR